MILLAIPTGVAKMAPTTMIAALHCRHHHALTEPSQLEEYALMGRGGPPTRIIAARPTIRRMLGRLSGGLSVG